MFNFTLPLYSLLCMGHVMWPTVDEREKAAYANKIEKIRLKQVFVDLDLQGDIEAVFQ